MTDAFVPGWQTEITINALDLTLVGSVGGLNFDRAALPKPIFGVNHRRELPGQQSGSLTAEGHVSVDSIASLIAIKDSDVTVPFTLQMGIAAGPTDAGAFSGDLAITSLGITTDAEGQWAWSIGGNFDGAPVYTAAP